MRWGASRDTTTLENLRVLCTRTAPAFIGVIYWQGCLPTVIPKLRTAIPGVPYHLMHVSSSCIVRQSTVENMRGGLSCTYKTPVLPSGNFFRSMHMYLAIAVLTPLFNGVLQSPVLLWGPTTLRCSGSNFPRPSAVSYWDPPFAGSGQQLDCSK